MPNFHVHFSRLRIEGGGGQSDSKTELRATKIVLPGPDGVILKIFSPNFLRTNCHFLLKRLLFFANILS
jgi:hypothetical protein